MNNNNDTTPTRTAEKKTGLGRLQGFFVVSAVLLPILAAYLVYYTGVGMPEDTSNQGQLLRPPVQVGQLPLVERGEPVRLEQQAVRWRYLILPAADCAAACEKLLYTSRQVHIRLGGKAGRVERLLVTARPPTDERRQQLQRNHPRLRLVQLDSAALERLRRQTAAANITDPRALLVDQQGFAMMAYDNHHSGNQLLKDIKRLLKYSENQAEKLGSE